MRWCLRQRTFFFFNDTATTEIYTLSLHDALPILRGVRSRASCSVTSSTMKRPRSARLKRRSEEHTSELQSRLHLVCRLLLEKKKRRVRRASDEHILTGHAQEARVKSPLDLLIVRA